MLSYIFMKILESRPHRYDLGIRLLTWGHAARVKDEIIADYIRPGMRVLDVGCGTGDLAVKAAKAGALVTGLDISEGMLAVAREKIRKNKLDGKIELHQAGVMEMDDLFEEDSFDLITSTLVISELYTRERQWTLTELHRMLKPSGTLVVAGEVQPANPVKRLVYRTLRLPLAIFTYLLSQTVTKAVKDIGEEIRKAGFEVAEERRSFLESFVTIAAKKTRIVPPTPEAETIRAEEDKSPAKTLFDYGGRWFPNPVEPGLRVIGAPDRNAPVVVTANFHLTVRRIEKALRGRDCYLLVAPTNGINVWCASAGGEMNTHSIVAALKTSRIAQLVDHRLLVLPQFAAPGIDLKLLKGITGWSGKWGPAYIRDLPSFLANGCTKTPKQCLARFPLAFRLEMLLAMNVSIWLAMALIALVIHPAWALLTTGIFWGAGFILYAGYPFLPFQSGWLKALFLCVVAITAFIVVSVSTTDHPWQYSGWMAFSCLAILSLGFDLKGIVGDRTSEAEALLHRLGMDTFGHFFRAKAVHRGCIVKDKSRCVNCRTCCLVCPMGVYDIAENGKDVIIVNDSVCLKCNACVRQCKKKALALA